MSACFLIRYNTPELCKPGPRPVLEPIGWNFGKFLVDGEGRVVKYYGPKINPLDTKEDCLKVLRGQLSGVSRIPQDDTEEASCGGGG